jgi:hypothetical protein
VGAPISSTTAAEDYGDRPFEGPDDAIDLAAISLSSVTKS